MDAQQPMRISGKSKKWPVWLLVLLVVLLLAAAGYLWWQLQGSKTREQQLKKDKQQLQTKIDTLQGKNTSHRMLSPTCNNTPSDSLKENIKAALDTKNTAVFATYTANPVKVVYAGTEKIGNETPDQAAQSMEYTHSATGPWDFELPATTLAQYEAGFYTDYFDANTYTGKAASGMVAAFDFDCNGKINQIFISASEDQLL